MHFFALLISTFFLTTANADISISATELLKKAEFIRNPQEDYTGNVSLLDLKKGKKETRTYEIQIKGRTKALVKFITPIVDKGTKLLMVEDQMWVHMPTTAKPIRISPRQRLSGNAAYGDVVRLNFTDNYTVKLKGEAKYEGKKAFILDLTSIDGKLVTYDRVEYWIDSKSQNPLKALYMTAGGKVLREGYFKKFENVLGVSRPTQVVLVDHLEKEHVTQLTFSNAKKADLPDLLFEKQNFGRD